MVGISMKITNHSIERAGARKYFVHVCSGDVDGQADLELARYLADENRRVKISQAQYHIRHAEAELDAEPKSKRAQARYTAAVAALVNVEENYAHSVWELEGSR